ncbi:MAG: PAS domain S-box protein [Vicinamibacteria bacterium]|nr:PAS domain S-box protein [Vicinamibacteria bacterium]
MTDDSRRPDLSTDETSAFRAEKEAPRRDIERQSENESLMEAVTDYVYSVRIENGRACETRHGPGCETVTGYKSDDFAADPCLWLSMVVEEDRSRVEEQAHRLLRGEECPPIEHRIRRRDGSVRWVRNTPVLHLDAEGRPTSHDGLIRDVTERKQAEEALRREHDILMRITETSPVAIMVNDRTGRITFCNATAERLLGLTRDEATRRAYNAPEWRITDFDGRPFPDDELPFRRVMATGRPVTGVKHAVQTPDGRRILLSINAAPLSDEQGRIDGMVATLSDVTERVRSDLALRESEERYRALVDQSLLGIGVSRGNQVLSANPALLRLFGYDSIEEFAGVPLIDHVAPASRATILDRSKKIRQGEPVSTEFEYDILRRDGQVRTLLASSSYFTVGDETYIQTTFQDVSARKRIEAVLEKERHELKRIIDTSPIIIFYKDSGSRFVRVNRVFAEALKMAEEDFVGKTVFDLYSRSIAQGMTDDDQEVMSACRPKLNIVEQHESAAGLRWIQTDKIPIVDDHGVCIGLIGFAQDITERKEAEEELRASEARLRTLLEASPDMTFLIDRDERVIYANPAAARLFNEVPERIIGRKQFDLFAYKDAMRHSVSLQRVLRTGKPFRIESPASTREHDLWIDTQLVPFTDAHGNVVSVLGIARDTTERRWAEDLTRAQLDLLIAANEKRSLPETLDICLTSAIRFSGMDAGGVYVRDPATDRLTLVCHHGFSEEFAGATAVIERDTPRSRIVFQGQPAYSQRREPNANLDEALLSERLKAVGVVPILHKGNVTGCLLVASHRLDEVPPRSRIAIETIAALAGGLLAGADSELALRESAARMASIVRAVPIGIGLVVNRALKQVNERLCEIVGRSADELVGQSARIMYPTDADYERAGQEQDRQIAEHGTGTVETRWTHKDGRILDLLLSSTPLDPNDLAQGVTFAALDITDRKRAEEERHRLEAQLRQQQKLESIGTLSAGVAHEINNPLMCIMNYAQLIVNRLPENDALRPYATNIVEESERVSTIVHDLLAFARQDERALSPARLCDIVERTLTLIRSLILKDRIALDADVPAELPTLKCRSQQIQQVLLNLLTNARDAVNERYPDADPSKRISVTARLYADDMRTWIRTIVEDTGNGVSPDAGARIFDPFFTTKTGGHGTGLGLSVSYGIVRAHNGRLSFESAPGETTRFFLDLPTEA